MTAIARDTIAKDHIGRARLIVSRFPLWKLQGAYVCKHSVPDTSNPSGYYHRGVSIYHKTWFGIKRWKTLYWERTAFDEEDQEAVYAYAKGLVESVNSALS